MADRKRIMIAEDDPDLIDLVCDFLRSEGYDVFSVTNGKDAVGKALSEKFDLILLDVMMPYVDGYHVAYEINNSDNPPRIIIMTSRDVQLEKGIGELSGACDMIQKPFELKELSDKVKKALSA
ncbi:MAG: response regulator transcription factor [Elusimicrobiota bacterium]